MLLSKGHRCTVVMTCFSVILFVVLISTATSLAVRRRSSLLANQAVRQHGNHLISSRDQSETVAESSLKLVTAKEDKDQGRLEIFHDGKWGTICNEKFGKADAVVACKNLGYATGRVKSNRDYSEMPIESLTEGEEEMPIWLSNLGCTGSEEKLINCWGRMNGYGKDDCFKDNFAKLDHSRDVFVECSRTEPVFESYPENSLRLVNEPGGDPSIGRLEIFHSGQWGSVCGLRFGQKEATVACVSMNAGYMSGKLYDKDEDRVWASSAWFQRLAVELPPPSEIWLDYIHCMRGDERSLLEDCDHKEWGEAFCLHSEDVIIQCLTTPPTDFAERSLRLVTAKEKKDQGRLELFHDGKWTTICNTNFGKDDAVVACKNLGYATGRVKNNRDYSGMPIESLTEGEEEVPFWLSNFGCTGSEKRLAECGAWLHGFDKDYDCKKDNFTKDDHSRDVFVECLRTQPVFESYPENSVRLVNEPGGDPSMGRLEIFHSGQWGSVCSLRFGQKEATVACVSMNAGYKSGNRYDKDEDRIWVSPAWFQRLAVELPPPSETWLERVRCYGHEKGLEDCGHRDWGAAFCPHYEDVIVQCLTTPPTDEPDTWDKH